MPNEGVIDQAPERTDFIFKDRHNQPDLKCGPSKVYRIDSSYDTRAVKIVKEQLEKAVSD